MNYIARLSIVFISACVVAKAVPVHAEDTGKNSSTVKSEADDDGDEDDDSTAAESPVGDDGLVATYQEAKNQKFKLIAAEIKNSEIFDEVIESTNETYKIPHIDVIFGECGVINAFYVIGKNKIAMCYELFQYFHDRFKEDTSLKKEDVMLKVNNAMVFIFFHELGHALTDVLELPITGKQEDAADDLATLVLLEAEEDEGEAISNAVDAFWLNAEETLDDIDFWNEHSLNSQRAARMMCLAYGSNPTKFKDWVGGEDGLPADRAAKCEHEYEVMSNAWSTLLEPHVKEGAA